ncbi:MAG: heme peroxidase, partial [Methylotenera sp.]|uniref:hypothetical protein n=1 Tax=Methylotenera sp. TaxID=2051956 RepID=UPI00181AEA89
MATNYTLKPYSFNFRDMEFLTKQINFRPLFDVNGNALIAWNGTGAINDVNGNQIWNGVYEVDLNAPGIHNAAEAIAAYGQSYASYTASQGLRNVSGEFNNLYLENALWGANDTPFLQRTQVIFDQYVKPLAATDAHAFYAKKFAISPIPANADYTKTETSPPLANVVDYTPRMISQLTTTAGATFATEVGGTHLIKDATNGFTQVANYGMLETLGQQDAQHSKNEDGTPNDEFFVGAINPGVSPVNGWFVLFGQFFDHGLDFVGKGGDGTKITINLSQNDPMYGVIDPTTGQP